MEDGIYTYDQFQKNRTEDHASIMKEYERRGKPENMIIVHPDNNEIICDVCNREISEDHGLIKVDHGYALCVTCQQSVLID